MRLPEVYLDKMKNILGENYDEFLSVFDSGPYTGLRINTSKINRDQFLHTSQFKLKEVSWCKNGFYYDPEDEPSRHTYYNAGLYYLQEPSAMAPGSFLDIEEDDYVLDLCSAPGGKATQLACKLNNTGIIVSNDISASRQNATLRNLERFGITNSFVISDDPEHLSEKWPASFDKILVDAPCSGEGMFRKDPSLIKFWLERGNDYYADLQKRIMDSAVRMLKPGGRLLYSTCTFSPTEDEEVVKHVLDNNPDLTLLPVRHPGFEPGIIEGLENCARLYPHKLKGEGHFLALLQKAGTNEKSTRKKNPFTCDNSTVNEFMKNISKDFSNYEVRILKDKVLFVPETSLSFDSVRVLRSGLLAGTIRKDVFEPSQQMAMALGKDEFSQIIDLKSDDIMTDKYLKGETIRVSSSLKGWVLVTCDGYPLGFGKISNGVIKNKIDPGWRKL